MPESAEQLHARIAAVAGPEERLQLPPVTEWETFPFEGDIRVRPLQPPVDAETARDGEGDRPCSRCRSDRTDIIWRNDDWQVASTPHPTGLPLVVFLESRDHMDFIDLDDTLAADFGRITSWLHRIMAYLPHVGRVHMGRFGDGGAHLHCWFAARPERLPQLRGSFSLVWDEVLPPAPEDVWRADLHEVARKLANHDGEAVV
jgi:hypothetical protein